MRIAKVAILLMAVMVLVPACAKKKVSPPLTTAPFYTSLEEAQAAMGDRELPIIVDFYTDWCKWCATIDTVVLVDSTVIDFFTDEMLLVRVNAEVDTLLRDEFNIRGYPTLVMLGTNGEEIDRLVGYLDAEPFVKTFRDYANGIGTLDDFLAQADTAAEVDREMYMEIAEKYKYRGNEAEASNWYHRVIDAGEPLDSLSGESRLSLADNIRRSEEWDKAIEAYTKIQEEFGPGPIGETAEIWTAIVCRQMADTAEAVKRFQAFMDNHPESRDVEYCQGQIKKLTAPPDTTTAEK